MVQQATEWLAGFLSAEKGKAMDSDQVFSCDKEVLGGIPVFVGTRVPVETLIDHLAAGDTLGKFLEDFPSVSQEKAKGFLELMGQRAIDEAGHANSPG